MTGTTTDLEYQRDAYKAVFEADVLAVPEDGAVILDRTCFYPGGGGQPHDLGVLSCDGWEVRVHRVSHGAGGVVHWIDGPAPAVGRRVRGSVDWSRRFALMRTHTALHIVCGVIWRDHRRLSTGCDMKPLAAHIDFQLDALDADVVAHLESSVNDEIAAARPIEVVLRPREEAECIPDLVRTKVNLLPEGLTHIRTVEIVGLDLQADGGTHVANTSEVGSVYIVRYKNKGRNNKRLYLELMAAQPTPQPI